METAAASHTSDVVVSLNVDADMALTLTECWSNFDYSDADTVVPRPVITSRHQRVLNGGAGWSRAGYLEQH
jgi:hypothetical protein